MRPALKFAFCLLAFCFLLPVSASAQVAVTGTITDPAGVPYSNAQITFQIQPTGTNPCVMVSGTCQAIAGLQVANTNAAGVFSANLYCNSTCSPSIQQSGTSWLITVTETGVPFPWGTGPQSFTYTATITAAVNLSTTLSGLAPALTQKVNPAGGLTSFNCGNLVNVFTCSVTPSPTGPGVTAVFAPLSSGPSLDCSTFPGSPDMGLQLNNCLAALSAAGGVADATHFSSPQTISTAVVNSINAVIVTCGISITESAGITLSGNNSSWVGCPDKTTVITKNANIEMFTVTGTDNQIQNLSLLGNKGGGFTGDDVFQNGSKRATISQNLIWAAASDAIKDTSTTYSLIQNNDIETWGTHAFEETNFCWDSLQNNTILGDGTGTGSAILAAGGSVLYVSSNPIIQDSVSSVLIDVSNTPNARIVANPHVTNGIGSAIHIGDGDFLADNAINSTGIAVFGEGRIINNSINSSVSVVQVSDNSVVMGNSVELNPASAESNQYGIEVTGTNASQAVISGNNVLISDSNNGDNNYGYGIVTVASGTFSSNTFVDNEFRTQLGGTATATGYYFNNAASVSNAAALNAWRNNKCIAATACVKWTDPGSNNTAAYSEFSTSSGPIYDSTSSGGATTSIITQTIQSVTFSALPTAGNGSQIMCSDCQLGIVAAAGGGGGLLYRIGGNWGGGRSWLACTGKGLGDGLNAIPAGTYLESTCKNTTGVTVTITGVQCLTDNAGSSTLNAAGNSLGALLTGAITCSSSYVAGTQSANVALTNGDFIKFTFVADGTSKQSDWIVSGVY